jgi:hypothetical protein
MTKAWCKVFNPYTESGLKELYLSTFSSSKWDNLSPAEKAQHSLSNCKACANNYPKEQESFPLKPIYRMEENECTSSVSFVEKEFKSFDAKCREIVGQPFADLANKYPKQFGLRDTDSELKAAIRATQKQCTKECNASLQNSALVAVYSNDVSLNKMEKLRKAQYYDPPDTSRPKKKRCALKASECTRFDDLVDKLKEWDSSCPFVATAVANEFNQIELIK